MPQTYLYKARDNTGKVWNGQMEAENERTVVLRLREQGYLVLSIAQEEIKVNILEKFQFFQRVSVKYLAIFCRQFATMLDAAVPLISCLHILIEQSENKVLQKIIVEVAKDVEAGNTLTKAFARYPHVFPNLFISLIQVGEATGILDAVLERLAVYYQKDYELKEKVKSAMSYPTLIILMSCGLIIFLLTFIIPMFEGVFESMQIELPLFTRIILGFSNFFISYWFLFLGVLGGAIYIFKAYSKTEQGRLNIDRVRMRVPVFGSLWKKLSFSRFSMSLAVMVGSGVPILHALEVAKDTFDNKILANAINGMQDSVRNGGSISAFLEVNKNFPLMMTKMIAIGEVSGSLDNMLSKVAEFYEKEVQFMIDRLAALLEPFLIVFLGIIVGGIVISIMLPLMSLIGNIGGG